jgi:hypothetical protein
LCSLWSKNEFCMSGWTRILKVSELWHGWGWIVAGLSPRSPKPNPWKMVVWFVADEVTLVHIFLRVFRFYHVTLIPPVFHNHIPFILFSRDVIISVDSVVKYHAPLFNIIRPLSTRAQKLTKSFVILVSRVQKWNNRQSLMFCGNYERKNSINRRFIHVSSDCVLLNLSLIQI